MARMSIWGWLLTSLLASVSSGAAPPDHPGAVAADRQSVRAFISVTDGQPGAAGGLTLSLTMAYLSAFGASYQTTIEYTPRNMSNAVFSAVVPTLNVGESATDFERSASLAWQQRWVCGQGGRSTFSTLMSIQLPYNAPGQKVDATLTGILVEEVGRGAAYFNAYGETLQGINGNSVEWGLIAGYKMPVRRAAAIGDVSLKRGEQLALEAAAEVDLGPVRVGPGASLSFDLDRSGGTSYGVGIQAACGF